MALPTQVQLKYWGIAAVLLAVVLWALGDVLLPFVLGSAIAYFLDPVADRLERMGASRVMATAIITIAAALAFLILALAVIPALVQQTLQLIDTAPQAFRDLQEFLTNRFPSLMESDSVLRETLVGLGETIKSKGAQLFETALTSALSVLNVILLFVIVPVVAVYMLLDWDNMIARIDTLLPRDHLPVIRRVASEVDTVLAGFVRGMGSVCLALGAYYALLLWIVGLQFGLVVGVIAGMLTFIPYVGAIVGGALAIGLAFFQFFGAEEVTNAAGAVIGHDTNWWRIVAVWAVFQSGQFIEGNILTPRWVGSSVGLHPVWLLLALSVFGSLFGFIGLLVAVPLAASLGVIARFAAEQYLTSRLYRGLDALADDREDGE